MASSSKKRTTMAKLNRERALIERRQEKAARKAARKLAAASPAPPSLDVQHMRYSGVEASVVAADDQS
jgi:uncharacterized protein HemY